jgi:hypothetical protein
MSTEFNIGLIGLAGSGKDTAAAIICKTSKHKQLSFATRLKDICLSLGWDGKKDERGRKLLQDMGMTFRDYHADTWINEIDKAIDKSGCYVFADVRFSNEADYIKNQLNGVIIRVVRPDLEITKTHKHISEAGQDQIPVDYDVLNDGSFEDLEKALELVINQEKSKRYASRCQKSKN